MFLFIYLKNLLNESQDRNVPAQSSTLLLLPVQVRRPAGHHGNVNINMKSPSEEESSSCEETLRIFLVPSAEAAEHESASIRGEGEEEEPLTLNSFKHLLTPSYGLY